MLAGDLLADAERPVFPFLALLVSGGHTSLVFLKGFRDYELVAETLDDAVGEAFDKCATLLGLPYPGGPALSKLAENGDATTLSLPLGVGKDSSSFSFSGLKTAFLREVKRRGTEALSEKEAANFAASIEKALVDSLVPKTVASAKRCKVTTVLLTGGVAANRRLRAELDASLSIAGIRTVVLPGKWCGDNAAMIATAALRKIQSPGFSSRTDDWVGLDARPRFPLNELCP